MVSNRVVLFARSAGPKLWQAGVRFSVFCIQKIETELKHGGCLFRLPLSELDEMKCSIVFSALVVKVCVDEFLLLRRA